ncbi:MAG: heme-binding domain-containing protein [Sulfurimonas sp.]
MKKLFRFVALPLITLLILIQLLPIDKGHTNPPILAEPMWDSQTTRKLFQRACADCHAHTTNWPWYSNIAPISWIITDHVEEGREHFNVSVWGIQKKNEGDEAAEEVEDGEMPIFGYEFTHPEARLTADEKKALIQGLKATFGSKKKDDEDH